MFEHFQWFGAIQRAYTKTLEEDRTYYIVVRSSTKKHIYQKPKIKKKIDIKKSAHCTDFFISSYRR